MCDVATLAYADHQAQQVATSRPKPLSKSFAVGFEAQSVCRKSCYGTDVCCALELTFHVLRVCFVFDAVADASCARHVPLYQFANELCHLCAPFAINQAKSI